MRTRNNTLVVITLLVLAAFLSTSLVFAQGGETVIPDLGGREINVAVENAYPPFNFIGEDGQPAGWDYEVWAEICSRLNCVANMEEWAWDGLFEAAASGEYDVAADGITITEDRAKVIDFSDPYMEYGQALLAVAARIASVTRPASPPRICRSPSSREPPMS